MHRTQLCGASLPLVPTRTSVKYIPGRKLGARVACILQIFNHVFVDLISMWKSIIRDHGSNLYVGHGCFIDVLSRTATYAHAIIFSAWIRIATEHPVSIHSLLTALYTLLYRCALVRKWGHAFLYVLVKVASWSGNPVLRYDRRALSTPTGWRTFLLGNVKSKSKHVFLVPSRYVQY